MKTSDIRSMGLAYLEVLEGKDNAARRAQKAAWDAEDNAVLAKAHAVNKHGHDHVGKEDDDVNNHKKVDGTDKYLLNRRKAISANVRKEEVEEVDEALKGNQHKIDANKNGKVDAHDFHLLRNKKTQRALASAKAQAKPKSAVSLAKTPYNEEAQEVEEVSNASKVFNRIAAKAGGGEKGKKMAAGLLNKMKKEETELDEVSANTLGTYSIKAAQQGDKRIAGQKMADEKIRKKYGYSSSAKVAAEATEWPIFARITEKLKLPSYKVSGIGDDPHEINVKYATDDKHTKGATKPEPMDSKASQSEKDFVAAHGGLKGNDSGISADKNADLNSKAVRTSMKQSPGRWNDQKIGDKTPPKASA